MNRRVRSPLDVYSPPSMDMSLRAVGPHLHPGSEFATVYLVDRLAAHGGFPNSGWVLDVASAIGAPARMVSRRFACSMLCIDMDRRMHDVARFAAQFEGVWLRVQQVQARTERLPVRDASLEGAWSQDAMCHMDKAAVVAEVARVLKPGTLFAFSDWIAKPGLNEGDSARLASLWGFPSLLRIEEYVALLAESGFEILLAEDRTAASLAVRPGAPPDQVEWEAYFSDHWGENELLAQAAPGEAWREMLGGGRTGYGAFIARRR